MEFLPEQADDAYEVEYLFDLSFAPGRQSLSSYQLREDVLPVASLCKIVRDETGALIGAIRYWPVSIAGYAGLMLGPVAVHPTAQGEGIAGQLIMMTLHQARDEGWKRVILIGDEPYYSRFGFSRALTLGLEFPPPTNPDRFLGLEFETGALADLKGKVEKFLNEPHTQGILRET